MKNKAMAIPNIAIGIFLLVVLGRGLCNNHDKLEFCFGSVAAAIIFIVVIVISFKEAWKIIRGKE
ncbi:MAG: hypothetical protein PHZ04_01340 [Patescibacteria group bacterium]|nr:hypothetical protein [Patescibacteria group bacterium]MDD5294467.1 hypothetical protein [Patescibacteria group bacterium]MDD5554378.1 hypothetical protein [Patescibacteria group bacterium]